MIQLSLVYNFKKRLRKDGRSFVYIRAYQDGKRKYFSTKILLKPRHWAERIHSVVDHPHSIELNRELKRQLMDFESFILDFLQKHGSITLEQAGLFYKYGDTKSFTKFWEVELNENTKLSKITKRNHKSALNYFKRFRANVQFSELTYQLVSDFDQFLFGFGLHTNTVYTHHKQVKKYINLAIRKDLLDANKNPYLKFTPGLKKTDRTVLDQVELNKLEQLELTEDNQHLTPVRDMFLFSCYTGLRFGDVTALKVGDLLDNGGALSINLVASKTDKQILLPLYKLHGGKPQLIVERYCQSPGQCLIFPAYTNQYYNRALKRLAALAGITKHLTSHVARHTFATHLASKVPIHVLKTILQHSKIETTMIYLHLSNRMVNDALDLVEW